MMRMRASRDARVLLVGAVRIKQTKLAWDDTRPETQILANKLGVTLEHLLSRTAGVDLCPIRWWENIALGTIHTLNAHRVHLMPNVDVVVVVGTHARSVLCGSPHLFAKVKAINIDCELAVGLPKTELWPSTDFDSLREILGDRL